MIKNYSWNSFSRFSNYQSINGELVALSRTLTVQHCCLRKWIKTERRNLEGICVTEEFQACGENVSKR